MSKFAKRIEAMQEETLKLHSLTNSLTTPNIISFAAGAPALEAYPIDLVRTLSQEIFHKDARGYEAFKYGSTFGVHALREAVRDCLLAPRGLKVDVEQIIITAGGIQPMSLLCQLFIDPGDVILVEAPSFVHATMVFKMFEARLIPCTMDQDGLCMEELEDKIRRYHPKMIYTVPTFQNPTGITLSLERRKKLAELGSTYDVIIFEDDPYREIRYSGEELPAIKSFDRTGHTIYTNSLSKIFSPGFRLGYMVADEAIIQKIRDIKLGLDTCTNTVAQVICAEFFQQGHYPKHRQALCDLYRSRRDAMLESLDRYFPQGTTHTLPDGGYYVWTELPAPLDATASAAEIAEKLNICYGIGSAFYSEGNPVGAGRNCMRLNFSGPTEVVIRENIEKLGGYFSEQLAQAKELSDGK